MEDVELDDLNYNYEIIDNYKNQDENEKVNLNVLKQNMYKIIVSGSNVIYEVIKITPLLYHYYQYYKFVRIFI
jgi:hypothetical protein